MPPGPDLRTKWEQRQAVFQFENPLGGLVAEQFHSDNSAGPTAQRPEQCQGSFRNTPAGLGRSPLVEAERAKGTDVNCYKPDDAKSIECIQTCQRLSWARSVGAKNS